MTVVPAGVLLTIVKLPVPPPRFATAPALLPVAPCPPAPPKPWSNPPRPPSPPLPPFRTTGVVCPGDTVALLGPPPPPCPPLPPAPHNRAAAPTPPVPPGKA